MNVFLNYLLEASIGFCLFLLVYKLFLSRETSFTASRFFLLAGIIASLTFPLFHFSTENSPIPTMNLSVQVYAPLQTTSVIPASDITPAPTFTIWQVLLLLYTTGLVVFLAVFLLRLRSMIKVFHRSTRHEYQGHTIIEVNNQNSPFSFFKYIFINTTSALSEKDKQQIVEHESLHARLYHSFDIILINLVGIVFWFHPLVHAYKKTLVQLHEFEADAHAVEMHDVDEYCSLLARVALQSADFKLANHFSNSLTVKRINMMRTRKVKTKRWKLAVVTACVPLFFIAVACQDQMMEDAVELANNSTMAIDYPKQVQEKLDELQQKFPKNKFVVLEPIETEGLMMAEDMKKSLAHIDPNSVKSVEIVKNIDDNGRKRSFVIINYDDRTKAVFERAVLPGEVFSAVEQAAAPKEGTNQLKVFIANNLKYEQPDKPGSVLVNFVINTDGSLTDFSVIKGLSAELDQEALRVAKLMDNWIPAQQNGKPVRSRFILPIHFGPAQTMARGQLIEIGTALEVQFTADKLSGKTILTGKVFDARGIPLPGASLMLAGTAKGTMTDSEGNFRFETSEASGKLVASFIGHKNKTISF